MGQQDRVGHETSEPGGHAESVYLCFSGLGEGFAPAAKNRCLQALAERRRLRFSLRLSVLRLFREARKKLHVL